MSINTPQDIIPRSIGRTPTPKKWKPPPNGFLKCNFDGACKGNTGNVGFRGILKKSQGEPLMIYYGNTGWDSNNFTNLEGLIQGIYKEIEFNYFPLQMEGHSQIITLVATRILHGVDSKKVSTS